MIVESALFDDFHQTGARLRENRMIRFETVVPYGALAESPKYSTCSFGIPLRISRATEMPPKPESNTPIGAVEVMIPPIFPS